MKEDDDETLVYIYNRFYLSISYFLVSSKEKCKFFWQTKWYRRVIPVWQRVMQFIKWVCYHWQSIRYSRESIRWYVFCSWLRKKNNMKSVAQNSSHQCNILSSFNFLFHEKHKRNIFLNQLSIKSLILLLSYISYWCLQMHEQWTVSADIGSVLHFVALCVLHFVWFFRKEWNLLRVIREWSQVFNDCLCCSWYPQKKHLEFSDETEASYVFDSESLERKPRNLERLTIRL